MSEMKKSDGSPGWFRGELDVALVAKVGDLVAMREESVVLSGEVVDKARVVVARMTVHFNSEVALHETLALVRAAVGEDRRQRAVERGLCSDCTHAVDKAVKERDMEYRRAAEAEFEGIQDADDLERIFGQDTPGAIIHEMCKREPRFVEHVAEATREKDTRIAELRLKLSRRILEADDERDTLKAEVARMQESLDSGDVAYAKLEAEVARLKGEIQLITAPTEAGGGLAARLKAELDAARKAIEEAAEHVGSLLVLIAQMHSEEEVQDAPLAVREAEHWLTAHGPKAQEVGRG